MARTDGTALPSWLNCDVDSDPDNLICQSTSVSKDDIATVYMRITASITSVNDPTITYQKMLSFYVYLRDSCASTTLEFTDAQLALLDGNFKSSDRIIYVMGSTALTYELFFVNDSVNRLYGSSTTSSICGT